MPWCAKILADVPVIETFYSGILTPAELNAAAQETLVLARAHGTNLLLGNCTALEGGHSIVDLFRLAEDLAKSGVGRTLKEAVLPPVAPGEAVKHVQFWETICRNRGIRVRVFADRQAALDWLIGK